MWFIVVEVEQETSAPPPKKNPGSAPVVGNQIYSRLSLLARQSMLMLTELPGIVTMFERFLQLEYSESYT